MRTWLFQVTPAKGFREMRIMSICMLICMPISMSEVCPWITWAVTWWCNSQGLTATAATLLFEHHYTENSLQWHSVISMSEHKLFKRIYGEFHCGLEKLASVINGHQASTCSCNMAYSHLQLPRCLEASSDLCPAESVIACITIHH